MREIKVVNTVQQDKSFTFQSDATTYGEIKDRLDVDPSNKVMVKSNKVTLEADGAELPEGDIILYVFPGKVKSGWDYEEAEDDEVDYEAQTKLDILNQKLDTVLEKIEVLFGAKVAAAQVVLAVAPTPAVVATQPAPKVVDEALAAELEEAERFRSEFGI